MKKQDSQRLLQEKRVRELEEMQEREQKEQEQRKLEGSHFLFVPWSSQCNRNAKSFVIPIVD